MLTHVLAVQFLAQYITLPVYTLSHDHLSTFYEQRMDRELSGCVYRLLSCVCRAHYSMAL